MNDALGACVTARESVGLVVILARTGAVACIRIGALGVTAIAASRIDRDETVVGTSTGSIAGVLDDAFCPGVATRKSRSLVVILARTGTVACIRIGALGVTTVAASRIDRDEAIVRASARSVAGVLDDTFCSGVTAGKAVRLVIILTGPGAVAGIGVRTFCVAAIATSRVDGDEAVVGAGTATVASVLNDAFGAGVAAGEPGSFVVVLASTRTVTCVRVCALGVTVITASRIDRDEAVVGAGTATVASVLNNALGSRVSAGKTRGFVVILARTGAIAGIGIGAFCVATISASRIGRDESVVRAGARTVAGVLNGTLGSGIATGEAVGFVIVLTCSGAVASIGVGTFCVATIATCRVDGNEAVVGARAGPVAGVLHGTFRSRVAARGAGGFIVGLAAAGGIAGVGVRALRVTVVTAVRVVGAFHAGRSGLAGGGGACKCARGRAAAVLAANRIVFAHDASRTYAGTAAFARGSRTTAVFAIARCIVYARDADSPVANTAFAI